MISEWFEKVKEVNFEPSKFFHQKKSEGYAEPSKFVGATGVFLGSLLTIFVLLASIFSSESLLAGLLASAILIPTLAIMLVVNAFFQSLLVHIAVYISGKRGLETTYNAVAYPVGATGVWAWIPVLNLFAGIYSLYLQAKGVEILHDMSFGKALICVAWPVVLSLILGIIAAVLLIFFGLFGLAIA